MQARLTVIALVAWGMSAAAGTALATDQAVAGTFIRLERSAAGERLVLVLNDSRLPVPAIAGADNPALNAGLRIKLFGHSFPGEIQELVVPPGLGRPGWTVQDSPRTRYQFRNGDAPAGSSSVRFVSLREGRGLRVVARTLGLALWAPQQSVGVRIEMGSTRLCTVFSGDAVRRDEAGLFVARGAPNPCLVECTDEALFRPGCELGASSGCNAPTVLVIALDGGDWRYMDPLIDGGYLPTLGAWRDGGTTGSTDCIGANPGFGCYCPMVHLSAMTGWPSSVHGIQGIGQPSTDRLKPAIWNVLHAQKPDARIALASMRNTWPPEAAPSHLVTEPGALMLAGQFHNLCTPSAQIAEQTWPGSSTMPGTWTKPASLFTDLGLLPNLEPVTPFFPPHGADFTAMRGLTALTDARPPGDFKLTAVTLHFIDKSLHLSCGEVHTAPFSDIDGGAIRASAAAWPGIDAHACPYGWGNAASSYLEADLLLADLLAAGKWDYVLIYSDHGMSLYPPGTISVPCHHTLDSPARTTASFGVHGPGVKVGQRLGGSLDVLCVAPLAAYLLGIPVSTELPCVAAGEFQALLADLFTAQHLSANPPRYVGQW